MDFGATGLLGGPGLWERALSGEGPRHGGTARWLIRDLGGPDDAWAMGALAQRAGILAGHADRAAPWLGPPGVVEDQDALGRTLRDQGPHALLVSGLGLPGRIGQERLQAFGRRPRHRRGDGVTVLARQVGQQPREGALHARPAGRAAEEWREGFQGGGEFRQGLWTGFRDDGRFHTG